MTGMGYMIDLSLFDQLGQIQSYYRPSIDVFGHEGSFYHIALGIVAGLLPDGFPPVAGMAFSGYEVSKLAAGESATLVAGSIIEFAIGLLVAAIMRRVMS